MGRPFSSLGDATLRDEACAALDERGASEGGLDAGGSLVNEGEEGVVGLRDVVLEDVDAVRLDEGNGPGGGEEGGGETGGRVGQGAAGGGGEGEGKGVGELVADGAGPGGESVARADGGDERIGAGFEEADIGALFGDGLVRELAEGLHGGGAGRTVVEGGEEVVAALLVEIEEHVFFAGEVIEDGHAGDVGGFGDLVDGDVVKATVDEEARGGVGDFLPGGEALAGLAAWGHRVELIELYRVQKYTWYKISDGGTAMSGMRQGNGERVLVVGASFAGLATAFWMHRLGYAVTVVEIAKELRRGGTPVDIREGVVAVVRRMGLLERIAAQSLPPRPMEFLDEEGVRVAGMAVQEDEDQEPVAEWEMERDVLLEMLFDEVKDDVGFVFGESVAGMEQDAEGVAVEFASGRRERYGLVFGCDGTHSAVRRLCFGEEVQFSLFLQHYFSLTIVNKLLIPENTQQMFNVPGKTVMLNAYNGKTDIGFCFFAEDEVPYDRRDRAGQRRMITEQFCSEGWRTGELLEEMERCEDFYFDKLCQIRMPTWVNGRVALVGDAGYCPSPAAGMGGSMAILGAAALAEAFQKHPGDYRTALAEYDRAVRPEIEAIQRQAVEEGLAMFAPRTAEAIERRNAQLIGR